MRVSLSRCLIICLSKFNLIHNNVLKSMMWCYFTHLNAHTHAHECASVFSIGICGSQFLRWKLWRWRSLLFSKRFDGVFTEVIANLCPRYNLGMMTSSNGNIFRVNNGDAGDLRHHRVPYDVFVMEHTMVHKQIYAVHADFHSLYFTVQTYASCPNICKHIIWLTREPAYNLRKNSIYAIQSLFYFFKCSYFCFCHLGNDMKTSRTKLFSGRK